MYSARLLLKMARLCYAKGAGSGATGALRAPVAPLPAGKRAPQAWAHRYNGKQALSIL